MTVCTASIFQFNNGGTGSASDFTPAIVAASDRMWTDEGIRVQYEGRLKKRVRLGRTWVLVAGAVSVHTAVIAKLGYLGERQDHMNAMEIATEYGKALREYTSERASQVFLAPYKMGMEDLVQTDNELTRELRSKVSDFANTIEVEALVMGVVGGRPYLISINRYGLLTRHEDIGFAAIGYGDIHAAAHFMQSGYAHQTAYFSALWRTFCAKKRAEVAPGVGKETDLMVITRDRVFDVPNRTRAKLEELYERLLKSRATQDKRIVEQLEAQNSVVPIYEDSWDNRLHDQQAITDGSGAEIPEDDSGSAEYTAEEPTGPKGPTGRSQRKAHA